jgi:dynein heavy chain
LKLLEPIFASPDIVKHLAVEANLFKDVDGNWRSMMNKINTSPLVKEFTKNRKFLDILKESHLNLEKV